MTDKRYEAQVLKEVLEAINAMEQFSKGMILLIEIDQDSLSFNPYRTMKTNLIGKDNAVSDEYQLSYLEKGMEYENERRMKAALTQIKDREVKVIKIQPNEKLCMNSSYS